MIALTKGCPIPPSLFVCLRNEKTGGFTTNFHQVVSTDPSVFFHSFNRPKGVLEAIALNILALVFPGEEIELPIGRCSTLAMSLHRMFVEDVLSTMPEEGGNLPFAVVRGWALEISANSLQQSAKVPA